MSANSDEFIADPYGYLTSRLGHICLGVFVAFFVSRACFEIIGEYPIRLHVWLISGALYLFVVELAFRGWNGWGTAERTIFTVFYGIGAPLYAFKETMPGDPLLTANMPALDVFFLAAGAHLLVGISLRIFQRLAARSK